MRLSLRGQALIAALPTAAALIVVAIRSVFLARCPGRAAS